MTVGRQVWYLSVYWKREGSNDGKYTSRACHYILVISSELYVIPVSNDDSLGYYLPMC